MIKQTLKSEKLNYLKSQFRSQASTAIITAFGLVIALAWKDVIVDFVATINPAKSNLLISAIIVTIISILGIALVSYWFNHPDKDEKK